MRNQPLYILTEDLNFFYIVKRELNKYKIHFQILDLDSKIPEIPSTVLTTASDFKIQCNKENVNYLVYSKNIDFGRYFLHVIAAVRIGYKKYYSTLTFSVDPGKKLGLMVFLDDYYLDSNCCFEKSYLFIIIQKYIDAFEEDKPTMMTLNFKLGRGVLDITYDLVKQIYFLFQNRNDLEVSLIDEFKSSQFRLSGNKVDKKFSRDEISALILALRSGIKVRFDNYEDIFDQLRMKKTFIGKILTEKSGNHDEPLLSLKDVVEKVLCGKITLSNAIDIINSNNA